MTVKEAMCSGSAPRVEHTEEIVTTQSGASTRSVGNRSQGNSKAAPELGSDAASHSSHRPSRRTPATPDSDDQGPRRLARPPGTLPKKLPASRRPTR